MTGVRRPRLSRQSTVPRPSRKWDAQSTRAAPHFDACPPSRGVPDASARRVRPAAPSPGAHGSLPPSPARSACRPPAPARSAARASGGASRRLSSLRRRVRRHFARAFGPPACPGPFGALSCNSLPGGTLGRVPCGSATANDGATPGPPRVELALARIRGSVERKPNWGIRRHSSRAARRDRAGHTFPWGRVLQESCVP
jgi:hypothetical protein